jgi:hypothetical protein
MRRFATFVAVGFAFLLAGGAGSALAGTRGRKPKKPGKQPVIKIPKHWKKCPKCGTYHPPRMPCPNCPPPGFVKCEKCGAFHVKGRRCAACAERKIPRREAKCPVCGKSFMGPVSFNHNDKGGTDRDFCRHSLGRDVVEALVWTCPRCGHTHWSPEVRGGKEYPGSFNERVDRKYARSVERRIKPLVSRLLLAEIRRAGVKLKGMVSEMDQLDMPDWIKYEAGYRCAELRGESAAVLAKLTLEGSYACRREMIKAVEFPVLSKIIPVLEGAMLRRGGSDKDPRTVIKVAVDMLRASELVERRKKKGRPLKPAEKYYLYLRISGCWDRLGNHDMAVESFKEATKATKGILAPPGMVRPLRALVDRRLDLLKKERDFRARSLKWMRKALTEDNAYPGASVMPTVYLFGELYRRQEDYGRARPWLVLSAKMAGRGHLLSKMVAETMKLPSMRRARVNEREESAALALVARLTGRKPSELVATEPGPSNGGIPVVEGKPENCSQCLANIYKAYAAYVDKNRKAPPELEVLVKEGYITKSAAAGFKCPECGTAFRYRRPKTPKSGDELIIWHPRTGKCKMLLLYADGKIKERK